MCSVLQRILQQRVNFSVCSLSFYQQDFGSWIYQHITVYFDSSSDRDPNSETVHRSNEKSNNEAYS